MYRFNTRARVSVIGLGFACTMMLLLPLTASSQDRPLVMIDAGHGGDEIGVVVEGWEEKGLVLEIAFVLAAEFSAAGYDVAFTRTGDEAVAWNDRRSGAEEAGADVLLMLHANQSEDPASHGAEIYVNTENARSNGLAEALGVALRADGSKAVVEHRPWPFLQSETTATAMLELAFMTNAEDARKLRESSFHHHLGEVMVGAVSEWMSARDN